MVLGSVAACLVEDWAIQKTSEIVTDFLLKARNTFRRSTEGQTDLMVRPLVEQVWETDNVWHIPQPFIASAINDLSEHGVATVLLV